MNDDGLAAGIKGQPAREHPQRGEHGQPDGHGLARCQRAGARPDGQVERVRVADPE
jgi:hypothetical protein